MDATFTKDAVDGHSAARVRRAVPGGRQRVGSGSAGSARAVRRGRGVLSQRPAQQALASPAMAQTNIGVAFTDYKHFTMLYSETQKGDVRNVRLQLYTRAPELFPEDAQKMQQLAPQAGLNPSEGALLPKSGALGPEAALGFEGALGPEVALDPPGPSACRGAMVPPPLSPPLCTLPPGPGPPRFVCYCEGEGSGTGERGGFNLYVTDAAELWSTCFTPDSLAALVGNRAPGRPAASSTPRLQRGRRVGSKGAAWDSPEGAACQQQAVTLTLQEDRASLTLSGGPSALEFDLSKVPGPEAASRLQALTLGLAERVCSLEQRLAAAAEETATSPRKSSRQVGPLLFLPDPDAQRGGPGPGVKRRCPGESLINPGFKRCPPTPPPSCAQGPSLDPARPSTPPWCHSLFSPSKKPAGGVDFDDP
ncbi:hypothetical protein J1605_017304 [Eschrichtius robustus]|uniref:Protein PAXX n=1 Tax=Eschrichtius robustus TaxID=9764 RepID=A0AB34I2W5_ESCRO|nr:hypothetical protein J1605_017304 [Eschrichtius robustus]